MKTSIHKEDFTVLEQRPDSKGLQLVELKRQIAGISSNRVPKRLKAKHIAQSTRELIVRLFAAYESYDDVAREMDMPGLTGKTVSEVIHAFQLRKPPSTEYGARVMSAGMRVA